MVATVGVAVQDTQEGEPNDDRANATMVSSGESVTGSVSNDDEPDYFAIEVQRGETINASVTVRGAPGTDVEIRGPDGDQLGQGDRGRNGTLLAGGTAVESGTYYVRLRTLQAGTVEYTLSVRTYATDEEEPDEDRGNATALTPGERYQRAISIGDTDYYSFEATAGQTINISAATDSSAGVEFDLETAAGNGIGGVRASNDADYGGVTASYTGTYYVEVTKLGGGAPPDYEMTVLLSETTDREPNEDPANATALSLNASVEDTISPGDTDWYALSVREGDSIQVSGTVADSDGAVDFKLQSANGTAIGGQNNVAGGEAYAFNTTAPVDGTYYIRVTRSSRPGPDYSMEVRTNGTGDLAPDSPNQATGGGDGDTTRADGDDDGDGDDGLPLLPLLVALVVVLLVLVYVRRRRREE